MKGAAERASYASASDSAWETVRLPHDWSILAGYQRKHTAASTGFTEGGVGVYRKVFHVPQSDSGRVIWVEFDGVYCQSRVRINGTQLGVRPNGYASFSYNLTDHIRYGQDNEILVWVDHAAYADSRWYTGSGIYRDVRLVKVSETHIPHWGVKITTPEVVAEQATVHIESQIEGADEHVTVDVSILDPAQNIVASVTGSSLTNKALFALDLTIEHPKRWSIGSPSLYTTVISVRQNGKLVDQVEERFGIRTFRFDAREGFFLNDSSVNIKGVNLHHDVGALGAAATKASWAYRISRLKSVGVNAIRMAHNPHSPLLMEVCDEMGMLVMNEFFDEWHHPKGKSVTYLGDNAASQEISAGYSDVFLDWAEKDLKALIHRDFNHPSVIMWSIGNEIEWTFPYYSKVFKEIEGDIREYVDAPTYDTAIIKPVFERVTGGIDSLTIVANLLSSWVREVDTTRPITCGSVRPSIAFASGYAEAVDVLGLNYRAADYDAAHKAFPDKCLLGSENWVAYSEWKACVERDFIPGIFVWTGFAYMGEAGPWPRKGLNISLFDFAGFKNPRGHFFECLWKPDPKVYMVTTPAAESEYSYTQEDGWTFDIQLTPPPVWNKLRLWEWYKVNEHWNYSPGEEIVVQTYTNCEEAELFLNGQSLGKQSLAEVAADDNIIKWLVPFEEGELTVVGYNQGKAVDEFQLASTGKLARIELKTDKTTLLADQYDMAHVSVALFDEAGHKIKDLDVEVSFEVTGAAELLAVDNGWEKNVDSHYSSKVMTHNGRALAIIRTGDQAGKAFVKATIGELASDALSLDVVK